MTKSLRIAFMGTPDFSVKALQALIDSDHDVVCVYSQPPRPKGRGKKVQASPVHQCAEAAAIEVRTPLNFKDPKDVEDFKSLNLDVAVVAAYGLILPKAILDAPTYGCVNIHASLLPRWRGAAPIQRAIWAGDTETGITLMQMDVGLDTGDMIAVEKIPINNQTICADLHDDLAAIGAKMIVPCLDQLAQEGGLTSTPQPEEGMTYAHMLKKEDGHIDWTKTAFEIDRQIRALNPWPATWSLLNGKRLKILKAFPLQEKVEGVAGKILSDGKIICGQGSLLQLDQIHPENKNVMDVKAALNGDLLHIGDVLL